MLSIENHGPLIVATNFWETPEEAAGKYLASLNAGAIRVLIPRSERAAIEECRPSQYAVLSRGPWPVRGLAEAVEILWEDGSDSPYAWTWALETFDILPAEPEAGREWVISLWDLKKNRPHKALERPCHWRRVPQIPWLKPWKGASHGQS